jgi:HEAT repeat protein
MVVAILMSAADAISILIEALGDRDHGPGAAAALSRIKPAAIPALVRALIQHPDNVVRRRAAFAIGNMGQAATEAAPDLTTAAKDDPDETVRAKANEALVIIQRSAS